MAFRREVFDRVGLFNPQLGRNGQSLVGGEENDLFARLRRAGELLYFVPNAAIYHHIPDSKLTDDYFDRLSYNVGVSKRMRAEADGEAETLLKKERTKQLATYLLYLLYMLMLQPLKAKYLLRMRNGIYKGVKQL
jgi:GT2 family glycosyltransferase